MLFLSLVKATISSGPWNMMWLLGTLREDKYGRTALDSLQQLKFRVTASQQMFEIGVWK